MIKIASVFTFLFLAIVPLTSNAGDNWLERSRRLSVEFATDLGRIYPERAASLGLSVFDSQGTRWSPTTESRYMRFLQKWKTRLDEDWSKETDINFKIDLGILKILVETSIDGISVRQSNIPFLGVSQEVYEQLFDLVNDQSPKERQEKAPERFRSYLKNDIAGNWEKIMSQKIAKTQNPFWMTQDQVNDYLTNSNDYLEETKKMLDSAGCNCDQEFAQFETQVKKYDEFVRSQVLPHARTNYRLPRDQYVQALKESGVEWQPEMLIERSQADFQVLYPKFLELTQQVGKKLGLPAERWTPVEVSQALRDQQVTGDARILEFVKGIIHDVTDVVNQHEVITLPDHPVDVRLGLGAEVEDMPFVHVNGAPVLGSNKQMPEFVFPVGEDGRAVDQDSAYRADAMTLIAHEAVPGHYLQAYTFLLKGSRTRVAFGATDANVEGWAVYVEHVLMDKYPDIESQYGAYQSVLFRMARAFLAPEVQTGEVGHDKIYDVLVNKLGLAASFIPGEERRYEWDGPGQIPSYYFGMRTLLDLKDKIKGLEAAGFSERWFNDGVLNAGPMPVGNLCELLEQQVTGSSTL